MASIMWLPTAKYQPQRGVHHPQARDHGIQAVLREGPEARVQDLIQQSN